VTGVDGLRAEIIEALRQRRWDADKHANDSREQDYRPGAPCMDCGDYPGPRHERSDCPRAVADAVLPVVTAYTDRVARERAAEELLAAAGAINEQRWHDRNGIGSARDAEQVVRDRAAALADVAREHDAGHDGQQR
jgi:hypothetical protein